LLHTSVEGEREAQERPCPLILGVHGCSTAVSVVKGESEG
jgi:hypothetical protein